MRRREGLGAAWGGEGGRKQGQGGKGSTPSTRVRPLRRFGRNWPREWQRPAWGAARDRHAAAAGGRCGSMVCLRSHRLLLHHPRTGQEPTAPFPPVGPTCRQKPCPFQPKALSSAACAASPSSPHLSCSNAAHCAHCCCASGDSSATSAGTAAAGACDAAVLASAGAENTMPLPPRRCRQCCRCSGGAAVNAGRSEGTVQRVAAVTAGRPPQGGAAAATIAAACRTDRC